MSYQTTVQDSKTIRVGGGKFEVGDDVGSLVNLGAMNGITFTESWERDKFSINNVAPWYGPLKNHEAGLAGDLVEINLEKLSNLRGGIDNYSTVAGTLVSGATQTVTSGSWNFNDFIKIENQNGDGSAITVNSVTGGTDGLLTANDDYYVGKNENGEYGIFVLDGITATTESQDLTINYDYTPAVAKVLKSGGKTTISPKVVRVTNTDENGKIFRITVFKASVNEGITIELQSDDSGDFAVTPINLVGVIDDTRTAGEQLFELWDEQSA